jgi:hypothetical protein
VWQLRQKRKERKVTVEQKEDVLGRGIERAGWTEGAREKNVWISQTPTQRLHQDAWPGFYRRPVTTDAQPVTRSSRIQRTCCTALTSCLALVAE